MRLVITMAVLVLPSVALAKPTGPTIFCGEYDSSPLCSGGNIACAVCHATPPAHNVYGLAVKDALGMRDFDTALPDALAAVAMMDSDGDGISNADELAIGTWPGDPASFPIIRECPTPEYDPSYVFEKVLLDVCGRRPTYENKQDFAALPTSGQMEALHIALDACLDSDFWLGKNGVLWEMAHRKIRPIGALKSGEDSGAIPVSDYYDDYNLFVYAHSDDHDVRDVLRADYFVERTDTTYTRVDDRVGQNVGAPRRAGLITTNWFLIYYVMFTSVPRTAAAQAYRAYLNLDIARLEGLQPVSNEPIDWDAKGVTEPTCAVCHSTLDPLTYPFTRYEGFPQARYNANRMQRFAYEAPGIENTPEQGVILGQPVNDLLEWVNVAANSDEFASAVTMDYWRLFLGREPTPEQRAEFDTLWNDLGTTHGFSVERMLHALIETEAYGVR